MGESWVLIEDHKWEKSTGGLVRTMKLHVSPKTISEETFAEIFEDVSEALVESGNMSADETASCITFPAGTKVYANEVKQA